MRTPISLLAAAFALVFVSHPSAHADDHGPKSSKPGANGKHGKGKGKGKHGPKAPKPKKDKGSFLRIEGAGQRLHFSFGGRLKHDPATDVLSGRFSIVVHPLSPPGDIVNTVCRYKEFSNPQRSGNQIEFDATGTCRTLSLDGSLASQSVTSHVTLVDNPSGDDAIDVDLVGPTGIAVPGGALSHGGFLFTDPTA